MITLFAQSTVIPCGRGLAPDSGGSADMVISLETAIGGKPPPTLVCVRHG
ncbi:hypothetical protein SAMN04490197_3818 [Pseudomonas orientalis]|uniref:Uncharacterized protein n=1 Tax=Pseudomonas orientalis TaxID=76758 RepID=A0A8B3Y0Q4_9PSED|nr:hypothetical protein SAMN04490197_3818 [Pseudomonas orientalis]